MPLRGGIPMSILDHFVQARSVLARATATSHAIALGRPISDVDTEDEETAEGGTGVETPPLVFHIIYQSAKGEQTARCITLQRIQQEIGEVRVVATCHTRNLRRDFLASRILQVTDLTTGEIHDDALTYFSHHPMLGMIRAEQLARRTAGSLAVQECRDEIVLLSFVAASDGLFHEDEMDAIVLHVMDRVPDPDVEERHVRAGIRSMIPNEIAFGQSLSRLCKGGGDARSLVRSLRKVVDADRIVASEEAVFVVEIEQELLAAGRIG